MYDLPFLRVYCTYNLCIFEDEKNHNEGRFTASVITYMLSGMFKGKDDPKVSYESHAKDLGIIPPKRKVAINKDTEVNKSNKAMDLIMNTNWG